MPTRDRSSQKNQLWERNRRLRLCVAFSDLAAVLPGEPTPRTKILILQRALQYIKELQKNCQGKENRCKDSPNESESLRKEILRLEEKCERLIETLEGLKASKLKSFKPDDRTEGAETISNEITTDDKIICPDARVSDSDGVDGEDFEVVIDKSDDFKDKKDSSDCEKSERKSDPSKRRKLKRKKVAQKLHKPVIMRAPVGNLSPLQSNNSNVWIANDGVGNAGGSFIMGHNILPWMSVTPSVLIPSPQQPGFIVLQKPKSKKFARPSIDNVTFIRGTPITTSYPNIFGVDVTKTTMVNKVPIPAVSSASKAAYKSTDTFCVTHRLRKKFLDSMKESKNIEKVKGIGEDNIKCRARIKIVESKRITEIKKSKIITESSESSENLSKKQIKLITKTEDKSPNAERNKVTKSKHEEAASDKSLNETRASESSENQSPLNSLSDDNKSLKNEAKTLLKENESKVNLNVLVQHSNLKCDQLDGLNSLLENKPKETCKIKKLNTLEHNTNASQESVNISLPDCRMELMKTMKRSDISMGAVEITEDLLASFGATNEQNMSSSPLASSPLATSPTAAFLLTFPLVSQGLRPDTPSNEHLQTPSICSLDHFSNFFSSKDNLTGSNQTNFFTEFPNKQVAIVTPEKVKPDIGIGPESKVTAEVALQQNVSTTSMEKFRKDESKNMIENNFIQKECVSSSSCIFSEASHNICHYSKPITSNALSDSVFNYEHAAIITNASKDLKTVNNTSKSQLCFDNIGSHNQYKNKPVVETNVFYNAASTSCFDPSAVGVNVNKNNSYSLSAASIEATVIKKVVASEPSMKLVVPGVIPEFDASVKPLDIQFSTHSQTKTLPSGNIYTSCNSYNQYNLNSGSNSANLPVPNVVQPNNIKTKMGYYELNSSNHYANCNAWNTSNLDSVQKGDHSVKKYNMFTNNANDNNNHLTSDNQPTTTYSKNVKTAPLDNKPRNSLKCNKESNKYILNENKTAKVDFNNSQKGPVNWMTSELNGIQFNGNDLFFQTNTKEIKNDQMNPSHNCGDPSIHSSTNCRKGELFEQPYYHLTSNANVPQSVNEENQFTWSPSKLAPLGDNMTMTTCSLPTLVGDLALGVLSDSKNSYQLLNTDDLAMKDTKHNLIKMKDSTNKSGSNHVIDMPSSNAASNFLSVTQLMERGKESIPNDLTRKNYTAQCQKKTSTNDVNYRTTNIQATNNMKLLEPFMVNYVGDAYSNQSGTSNKSNAKTESNNKNANKINYSAEALIQNNQTEYNNRKYKHQKSQEMLNTTGNSISGYPLQFDTYNQSSQYMTNAFPYGNSSTVSNTFYTTSNFISTSNNMMTSSYMNSGLLSDINEFSNSTSDNIFFIPKLDNCKNKSQIDNGTTLDSKEFALSKHKVDGTKKEPNPKRQKKSRNLTEQFNNISDKCYTALGNNLVPSVVGDDAIFGYFPPGQGHPYTSQTGTLPPVHSELPTNQRNHVSFGKVSSSSQILSSSVPVSGSLTNFNLSTIFPEINKRNSMTGMQYSSNGAVKPPILFH